MVDDTRLRELAKQYGYRYSWKTWKQGNHWHAEVKAWEGDRVVGWFGSNAIDTEQSVLDHAITLLIRGNRMRQNEPINLMNPTAQGTRQGKRRSDQ